MPPKWVGVKQHAARRLVFESKGDSNALVSPVQLERKTGEPCGSTPESPKRGDAERRDKAHRYCFSSFVLTIMGLPGPATPTACSGKRHSMVCCCEEIKMLGGENNGAARAAGPDAQLRWFFEQVCGGAGNVEQFRQRFE